VVSLTIYFLFMAVPPSEKDVLMDVSAKKR